MLDLLPTRARWAERSCSCSISCNETRLPGGYRKSELEDVAVRIGDVRIRDAGRVFAAFD